MNKAIIGKFAVSALIAGVLAASISVSAQARDRGVNQPGAVGNAVAGPGGASGAREDSIGAVVALFICESSW